MQELRQRWKNKVVDKRTSKQNLHTLTYDTVWKNFQVQFISTKIMATLSAKIRFMSILPTLLPFLPNNVNFLYFYEYIDHLHNNIELEGRGGGGQWYQKISARCKWKKIRGGLQKIIPLTCNSGVRAGLSRFICTSSAIPRLLLLTNEWFILMRQE